jgi:YggT family protein
MVMLYVARLINLVAFLLIFLIISDSIISFFLSPFHPVREVLDRIVNPLLAPIRKIVPLVGMWDISPLILIVLIEILARIMIGLLSVF